MSEDLEVIVRADTSQLDAELNKASNKLKNFQGASNKAGMALNDLSRIVQDAPYGFIGISNNINPLVESFGRLKAVTKSNYGAFKELLAGLSGPAGLGLAFGVISAAISFASIGLERWVKKTGEAKVAVDEAKKAMDSMYKSVADEAVQVVSNIAILKNETETRYRKLDALKELQKINPEIFNGLKLEGQAVLGLDTAYQSYINRLKTVVAAKVIQAKLEKELTALIELQGLTQTSAEKKAAENSTFFLEQRVKQLRELGDQGSIQADIFQRQIDEIKGFNDGLKNTQIQQRTQNIKDLTKSLSELSLGLKTSGSSAKDAAKELAKSQGDSIKDILAKFERQLIATENIGLIPYDVIKKKIDAFEAVITKLIKDKLVNPKSETIIGLQSRLEDLQLEKKIIDFRNSIEYQLKKPISTPIELDIVPPDPKKMRTGLPRLEAGKLGFSEYWLKVAGYFSMSDEAANKITEGFKQAKEVAQKGIAEVLGSIAPDSLIAIGEALGAAIASGTDPVLAGFNALFGVIGDAMIQLGKYAIEYSTAILALKEVLKKAGGVSGIAIGVGLILLGSLIKSSINGIGKKAAFATGTLSAPGGMALVGERGPEMVNLPRGARVTPAAQTASMMGGISQGIEVFGMLRGQDIYFSNKKYSKTYNRAT